jgi:hypothetical protein
VTSQERLRQLEAALLDAAAEPAQAAAA